jgi:mRNA-degrading endonuclease RelE of RelBE toxin-antitoxin system
MRSAEMRLNRERSYLTTIIPWSLPGVIPFRPIAPHPVFISVGISGTLNSENVARVGVRDHMTGSSIGLLQSRIPGMAGYEIEVTEDARTDLSFYTAFERKIIVTEIQVQLMHQPLVATRNRKPLRENPISSWELRIDKYRIFYDVDETTHKVAVVSVGHKEHNILLIRGKQVQV